MSDKRRPSPDDPMVIPLEEPADERKPIVCRMCFAKRLERDSPCPSCGFDERAGLSPSTVIGKRPIGKSGMTCAKCGYDMTGLPSPRCPECGTVVIAKNRRAYDREESRRIAIETYRTPLLMLGIGGGILFLTALFTAGFAGAAILMLSYAVQVPIGLAVFLFCCMLWIGFDAPIHLTALRLAAIYTVVDLVYHVIGYFLPFPILTWFIAVIVYIGLLSELLEMEWQDAAMVGVLTYAAKVIIGLGIIAMLIGS